MAHLIIKCFEAFITYPGASLTYFRIKVSYLRRFIIVINTVSNFIKIDARKKKAIE